MTRRERLERKLEKRSEWAQKATFKAATSFNTARRLGSMIPFGQPILIGHHSEGRARRDAERIMGGMSKGVELTKLASHHAGAAAGLERQLATSIFSDDANAIEALEVKIAKAEAEQAQNKAINAAIRKHAKKGAAAQTAALVALGYSETLAAKLLEPVYGRVGVPSYVSTNNAANIRRMKGRIEEIKVRQARAAKAEEAAGGVLIEKGGNMARVTFPEKPAREVLEALRAAGFRWGGGSWIGYVSKLPVELEQKSEAA